MKGEKSVYISKFAAIALAVAGLLAVGPASAMPAGQSPWSSTETGCAHPSAPGAFDSGSWYTNEATGMDVCFKTHDGLGTSGTIGGVEFVPDQLIVKFKNDSQPFRVVSLARGSGVAQAVAEYEKNPNVEYAEPNYIAYALMVPNDLLYGYQWNFDNATSGGVHAEAAWDISTGSGVVVAVVDTGVAYENYNDGKKQYAKAPDLAATTFVQGYDFVNGDTHANDDASHGTHVAGTVAQSTNNSLGVAGLAHGASIMPVKVLGRNGSGSYANIAAGINFAVTNGARVINLSLGGYSPSLTLENAVANAYNGGVVVVAAAGNDNTNAVLYPAGYNNYVISVGATRYDEALAPYSNFGPSVDVVAPGGDTSVDQNGDGYGDGVLQNTFNPISKNTSDFGYWFFQGTSMSSPHVAALAALLIANGNATTSNNVRTAIESTADNLGVPGKDDTYGWGLINAPAALAWTAGPVDNPPTVSITSPLGGATVAGAAVSVTATAADDNPPVTQVEFYIDGFWEVTDTTSPYEFVWNSTLVSEGAHALMATAYDSASQTSSHSINVTVDNINNPPIANAGADQAAVEGGTVNFNGSGSTDDRGIASYSWDFDSTNGIGVDATGTTASHIYATAGIYNATLTVTDTDGVSASDIAVITVTVPPVTPTRVIVNSISYATEGGKNGDRHLLVTVELRDNLGIAVSGASVGVTLTRQEGGSWPGSGTTGTNGMVTFTLKNAPSGNYSTSVGSVSASGLTWDGTYPPNSFVKP